MRTRKPMARPRSEQTGFAWGLAGALAELALESQAVIGLRLLKLSRGGQGAVIEAQRMAAEKVTAFGQAAQHAMFAMMTGKTASLPSTTTALYRRKVKANRKRLSHR